METAVLYKQEAFEKAWDYIVAVTTSRTRSATALLIFSSYKKEAVKGIHNKRVHKWMKDI